MIRSCCRVPLREPGTRGISGSPSGLIELVRDRGWSGQCGGVDIEREYEQVLPLVLAAIEMGDVPGKRQDDVEDADDLESDDQVLHDAVLDPLIDEDG